MFSNKNNLKTIYKYQEEYEIPKIINNKWILGKKIGSGNFGIVFKCKNINKKKLDYKLVIKIGFIKKENKKSSIFNEIFYVYQHIKEKNYHFLPKITEYNYSSDGSYYNYIVMEKLKPIKVLTPEIIKKIFQCIKNFHFLGLSHNDIKLENIMIRKRKQKEFDVVLTDFGLTSYTNIITKNVFGTPRYMSINAHSKKITNLNDIESLLYTLIYYSCGNILEINESKLDLKNKLKYFKNEKKKIMLNIINLSDFSQNKKLIKFFKDFLDYIKYSIDIEEFEYETVEKLFLQIDNIQFDKK